MVIFFIVVLRFKFIIGLRFEILSVVVCLVFVGVCVGICGICGCFGMLCCLCCIFCFCLVMIIVKLSVVVGLGMFFLLLFII